MQNSHWAPEEGLNTDTSSTKDTRSNRHKAKAPRKKFLQVSRDLPRMTDKEKEDTAKASISSRTRSQRRRQSQPDDALSNQDEEQALLTEPSCQRQGNLTTNVQDKNGQQAITGEPFPVGIPQLRTEIRNIPLRPLMPLSVPASILADSSTSTNIPSPPSAASVGNQHTRPGAGPNIFLKQQAARRRSFLSMSDRQQTTRRIVSPLGLPLENEWRDPSYPTVRLRPAPIPTVAYLRRAESAPKRQEIARPLLIIMDLNGCLLDRGAKKSGSGHPRPFLRDFIKSCSQKHTTMVWSSATSKNVQSMSSMVFPVKVKQPVAIWDRSSLRLTQKEAEQKVQVYKELSWVWEDVAIAKTHPFAMSGGSWNQTNTVLIDDTLEKAAAEPHNQLLIPSYKKENDKQEREQKVLLKAIEYLDEAAQYEDVSCFIRTCPFRDWIDGAAAFGGSLTRDDAVDVIEKLESSSHSN